MSSFISLKSLEIAAPTTAAAASDVSLAKVVRAVNTDATNAYAVTTFTYPQYDDSASTSLGQGEAIYINKEPGSRVFAANAAVKLSKVGYPRG